MSHHYWHRGILCVLCGITGFSLACNRISLGSSDDGCHLAIPLYLLVGFALCIIGLILGITILVRTGRLVVLVISIILIIFLALSAPSKMILGYPKARVAKLQIKEFEGAIELFQKDMSRLPKTDEGLDALVHNPGNIHGWKGPYLPEKEIPLDPWQRLFHYRNPGLHNPDSYDLWSDGKDGIEGTKDDIIRFK